MLDLIQTVSPWSGTFLSIVRVVPELSVFAGVWFSLKIQPSIKLYMYFILHLTSTLSLAASQSYVWMVYLSVNRAEEWINAHCVQSAVSRAQTGCIRTVRGSR